MGPGAHAPLSRVPPAVTSGACEACEDYWREAGVIVPRFAPEPDTELIQFSPADELQKTSEVIMKNMQAMQGA